jgi:hypothetical protein
LGEESCFSRCSGLWRQGAIWVLRLAVSVGIWGRRRWPRARRRRCVVWELGDGDLVLVKDPDHALGCARYVGFWAGQRAVYASDKTPPKPSIPGESGMLGFGWQIGRYIPVLKPRSNPTYRGATGMWHFGRKKLPVYTGPHTSQNLTYRSVLVFATRRLGLSWVSATCESRAGALGRWRPANGFLSSSPDLGQGIRLSLPQASWISVRLAAAQSGTASSVAAAPCPGSAVRPGRQHRHSGGWGARRLGEDWALGSLGCGTLEVGHLGRVETGRTPGSQRREQQGWALGDLQCRQ